ncbi:MAG: hypothetical protein V1685_02040 [Parcubacteria group bacterium]
MGGQFVIYLCLFIGSTIGGYIPTLWHDDLFSLWSVVFATIGGAVGVWIGFKIKQAIEG